VLLRMVGAGLAGGALIAFQSRNGRRFRIRRTGLQPSTAGAYQRHVEIAGWVRWPQPAVAPLWSMADVPQR